MHRIILVVSLLGLVGCGGADNPTDQTETPPQVAITISDDWLPMPALEEDLSRLSAEYLKATNAGDLANIALSSQRIGEYHFGRGNKTSGLKFYAQAGRALRAAREDKASIVIRPQDEIAIYYYEARALAKANMLEGASKALGDSILSGFNNFPMLTADPELAAVRAMPDFAEKLKAWQKERLQIELASATPFPFDFSESDIDGNLISLADLRGKVVIVDFWGTWCPPCRQEIPSFMKIQKEYGAQGVQVIGLNFERTNSADRAKTLVNDFVQAVGLNYPCILGSDNVKEQVPAFASFPTTIFIGKSGEVRLKAEGYHDYEYIQGVVELLLAEE